jgi:hypothetical protein
MDSRSSASVQEHQSDVPWLIECRSSGAYSSDGYPSSLIQSHGILGSLDGGVRGTRHRLKILFGLTDFGICSSSRIREALGSSRLFVGGVNKFLSLFAAAEILEKADSDATQSKERYGSSEQNHKFFARTEPVFKIGYSILLGLVGYLLCVWAEWVIWRRWDTGGFCYGLLLYGIAGLFIYHALALWIS